MPKPHYPPPPAPPQQHHYTQRPPQRPTGRTNIASCIIATIFILFIIIITLILYFTLLKPTNPTISITSIQLPSFALLNNTLTFTFSQYSKVNNPNKSSFSHYDSSLQLLYAGKQVGFMFIPAGTIEPGRTQYMAATFAVQSFPLAEEGRKVVLGGGLPAVGGYGGLPVGPTIELESRMEMEGKVRVLRVFTHHVRAKAGCMVAISVTDGAVLGFHC